MIDLISLTSTALAFFVVAVSPGPANISNATIAMTYGRRTSLIYGAGLSCGLIVSRKNAPRSKFSRTEIQMATGR